MNEVDDPVSRSARAMAMCPSGVCTLTWHVMNRVVEFENCRL